MDIHVLKTLCEELPINYFNKSVEVETANHEYRMAEYNLEIAKAKKLLEIKQQGKKTVQEIEAIVIIETQVLSLEVVKTESKFRKAKAELIGIEKQIDSLRELSAFMRREMKTLPTGEIESIENKTF